MGVIASPEAHAHSAKTPTKTLKRSTGDSTLRATRRKWRLSPNNCIRDAIPQQYYVAINVLVPSTIYVWFVQQGCVFAVHLLRWVHSVVGWSEAPGRAVQE